jgi:hypothetical protein
MLLLVPTFLEYKPYHRPKPIVHNGSLVIAISPILLLVHMGKKKVHYDDRLPDNMKEVKYLLEVLSHK